MFYTYGSNYLLGLRFDIAGTDDVINFIEISCKQPQSIPRHIVTINTNFIALSRKDPYFRQVLLDADICCIDGMPIIWLHDFLGLAHKGRVAGSDLLLELIASKLSAKVRVYVFGSTEDSVIIAIDRIRANGNLEIAGYTSPGFVSLEELSRDEYINAINNSHSDMLLVSLSAGKAIRWIGKNREKLKVKLVFQVGAAVDFISGKQIRAPLYFRKLGLEWIWRIIHNPRLTGRYLLDGAMLIYLFLRYIVPQKLHGKNSIHNN
jgi:N-acetylglucosaminyldiphosphoundecaprenol N-acetyl-beta-D-mannosaminyltransferase